MRGTDKLLDFIRRAERNYKYKPNTAAALSAAVRLFNDVLTEDEIGQEYFPIDKLDEIAERIHTKFPQKYSLESLDTYRSRMNRVVGDFVKYGADAKSMTSWNPLAKQRQRKITSSTSNSTQLSKQGPTVSEDKPAVTLATSAVTVPGLQDVTLPLADGRNVVIYYPIDLTELEAEKIGTVLKGIAALTKAA